MKHLNRVIIKPIVLSITFSWISIGLNAQSYAPVDFVDYLGVYQNAIPDNAGMIQVECAYNEDGDDFGNVTIHLIHKDGGVDWVKETFTRFPIPAGEKYYDDPPFTAGKRLLNEDKVDLIEFAKWAFFIDKQYLESFTETVEGGDYTSWSPKDDTPLEVILYQQLPGEAKWLEMERKSFNDVEAYWNSDWESNFTKAKAKEYNSGKGASRPMIYSNFTSDRGGWVHNGTVTTTLEQGRLKVSGVDKAFEGVRRELSELTITPGKRLNISLNFYKGNTNANVRLYVQELSASGKHLSWNTLNGNLKTGIQSYSYTIKEGRKAVLRIDKNKTHLDQTTYFYVDNIVISE